MDNSLSLSVEKTEIITDEKIQEIKRILRTFSSTPIDYVFSKNYEKNELEKLLEKLPYYELVTSSFFILIEPYYSISQKLQDYRKTKGCVYFILNPETGLVKIGRSKNPINRLANLKLCVKNPKFLLKIFVTNHIVAEKRLHNFFKNKNVYREWFKIDSKDIEIAKKFLISEGLSYERA